MAELHAAGVVCMNLKPSNLLLDEDGRAVVSDYGLPAILKKPSCRRIRSECDSSRTHSCMDCTMLSPNYTAPEAWEPEKKSLNIFWDGALGISPESDAWSFGCTLVEMCTGSVPYGCFLFYNLFLDFLTPNIYGLGKKYRTVLVVHFFILFL